MFLFPCVFFPCRITSDLTFLLVFFVIFKFSIYQFSLDSEILSSRSAADGLCHKNARIFTLTTSAHLFVAVVSMSVQSAGGDENHVFSPVGMARAAAIPVAALEAEDLMGETPSGKEARCADPADQTPDQKAEEIVKKTFGSNLEKTMLEDLKRIVTMFFKLTNRLARSTN